VALWPAWRGSEACEDGARWPALSNCRGKRREWASPSDRPREDKAHGVAAACAACGGREASGARWDRSWRGWDVVLAVGIDAWSERCPGARAQRKEGGWARLV
jgi:hypothetical protein